MSIWKIESEEAVVSIIPETQRETIDKISELLNAESSNEIGMSEKPIISKPFIKATGSSYADLCLVAFESKTLFIDCIKKKFLQIHLGCRL